MAFEPAVAYPMAAPIRPPATIKPIDSAALLSLSEPPIAIAAPIPPAINPYVV